MLVWEIDGEIIYSKDFLYLLLEARVCQRLHPHCKLVRDNLIGCMSHAWLRFSALCLNLTAWFSSRRLLPVTYLLYPSALIVPAHFTKHTEPNIHGICYIRHVFRTFSEDFKTSRLTSYSGGFKMVRLTFSSEDFKIVSTRSQARNRCRAQVY